MSGFFLGDQHELDIKRARENNINTGKYTEELQTKSGNGRLKDADIELLSEDTLKRLKRTRLSNKNLYDIYMVPDPEYYDPYYNNPEGEGSDPIISLARTIKRVYKTYPDYLTAVNIRERYVDYIIDKYGGPQRYMIMRRAKMVDDWMPPTPIYSKTAYDRYILDYGTFIDPTEVEINDDAIVEWIETRLDALHIDPKDLDVVFDIFTDIRHYNNDILKNGITTKGAVNVSARRTLNAADIEGLNNIVKSWYVSDDKLELESAKEDEHELFSLSPDNIRKQYMEDSHIGDSERYDLIRKLGEDALDDYDPNEIVVDDKTGKSMKASELKRRMVIRHLATCGWDEIALLQQTGTASNYELSTLKRNRNNKKKSKKIASSAAAHILGEDALSGLESSAIDIFGPDIVAQVFKRGE